MSFSKSRTADAWTISSEMWSVRAMRRRRYNTYYVVRVQFVSRCVSSGCMKYDLLQIPCSHAYIFHRRVSLSLARSFALSLSFSHLIHTDRIMLSLLPFAFGFWLFSSHWLKTGFFVSSESLKSYSVWLHTAGGTAYQVIVGARGITCFYAMHANDDVRIWNNDEMPTENFR